MLHCGTASVLKKSAVLKTELTDTQRFASARIPPLPPPGSGISEMQFLFYKRQINIPILPGCFEA